MAVFSNLGEQLRAIALAEMTYGHPDGRLFQIRSTIAPAGGSETIPSDGGFLIVPEFSKAIVERMYQTGDILSRCFEVPITGNTNAFAFPQFDESSRVNGSRLGGLQVYSENEAQNLLPASLQSSNRTQKPSFSLSTITANKLTGLLFLSNQISVDSAAFSTWSEYAFSQELTFVLENQIIVGSGAGECLGILNSPALVTVAAQVGQASQSVVSANISGMLAAFWAKSYNSKSAVWLYNQSLQGQLSALTTVVGSAGSESKLWQWRQNDDDYDRLAGLPAVMSEYCLPPGQTGDLLLVDLNRYILAVREKQRAEVSIHVLFLSDQSAFRFICRAGGQPIDRSPVVALNSGSPPVSTSPFVALAPRP